MSGVSIAAAAEADGPTTTSPTKTVVVTVERSLVASFRDTQTFAASEFAVARSVGILGQVGYGSVHTRAGESTRVIDLAAQVRFDPGGFDGDERQTVRGAFFCALDVGWQRLLDRVEWSNDPPLYPGLAITPIVGLRMRLGMCRRTRSIRLLLLARRHGSRLRRLAIAAGGAIEKS
jgi:hypothetical protein